MKSSDYQGSSAQDNLVQDKLLEILKREILNCVTGDIHRKLEIRSRLDNPMDVQKRREWLKSQPGSMCWHGDRRAPEGSKVLMLSLCL